MATIADFLEIKKTDSCKHLSTGMRYPVFTQWAGFLVPEFSDNIKAGSDEYMSLKKSISSYTQDRIGCSHDIMLLFCHAISESVSENVKNLNGSLSVEYLSKCNNATEFLEIIKRTKEKYNDKINFRPFLGLDSDNENNLPLANMILESGLFEGIELYGTAFVETPEKFLAIFKSAHELNIETRISCQGLKNLQSRDELFELMLNFRPTHLLNPNIGLSNDKLKIFKDGKLYPEIVNFIHDNNIHIEFSPAPTLAERKPKEKAFAIREFAENDIDFSFCTEDVLFLGKSLSTFAADLCNLGVFSVEEMKGILLK